MFSSSYIYVPSVIPYISALVILIIAGGFAANVPLKPLLTVNISLSVIAAAILFPISIWKSDALIDSDITVLFLIGLVLLLILLPNIILFIKFRTLRKPRRFKSFIIKPVILFLCHIPSMLLIVIYVACLRIVVMY